jgi:hypothetical protein
VKDNLVDSWSPCPSGFGPISAEAPKSLNAAEDKESPQQEDNCSRCNGKKNEDLGPRKDVRSLGP